MNELLYEKDVQIENMIYEIRGKQVMLDSDLVKLYNCANGTKSINLAVKRHKNRFPERFMFQLTKEEYYYIQRFRIETFKLKQTQQSKYLPYAFTEQGVAMLATVLRTPVAEEVSIAIMDAFVSMRKYISSNLIPNEVAKYKLLEHDKRISLLEKTFDSFKEKNNHIFFQGQIYDAYSLLLDIIESAKESIIIIDNYIDKKLLDMLSKTNKEIIIYSKNFNYELIEKYDKQHNNIKIIESDLFHDRFIIIDKRILYHCGASFKDLGKECFAINKIEDENIISNILNKIII